MNFKNPVTLGKIRQGKKGYAQQLFSDEGKTVLPFIFPSDRVISERLYSCKKKYHAEHNLFFFFNYGS